MKKLISMVALAALAMLSACSKTANLDGFKDIKFDQTAQQLTASGFTCEKDGDCKPTSASEGKPGKAPSYTLFGKAADVSAGMKSGKVQNIHVTVPLTSEETLKLLAGEYGKPKSFDYESFGGGQARKTYWLFGGGTALVVTGSVSEGEAVAITPMQSYMSNYLHNHTTVEYLNKSETDDLLKESAKNTVNPHDA